MRCIKRLLSGENEVKLIDEHVDTPIPEANEVLIKVKACDLSIANSAVLTDVQKQDKRSTGSLGEGVSGVVTCVGSSVVNFAVNDAVVGILPLDSHSSCCGEYCVISEFDIVKKPLHLDHIDAAAGIRDLVHAYIALYYHAKLCGGETALVLDGGTPRGSAAVQLAHLWGAKVMTSYSSPEERQHLESLQYPIAQAIELSHKNNILVSSVMEETGGLGVDCVLDNGVRMFTANEEPSTFPLPHKNDIISCLGFSGKWVTSQCDLQLDPPDARNLFMRGGSVNFFFPEAWSLTSAQAGRYKHILQDAVDKLDKGAIKCKVAKEVTLDDVGGIINKMNNIRVGRVILRLD